MPEDQKDLPKKVTLNDPAFRDRTRGQFQSRPISYTPRSSISSPQPVSDFVSAPKQVPKPQPAPLVAAVPSPVSTPAPKTEPISVPEQVGPVEKIPALPVPAPTGGLVQIAQPDAAKPKKSGRRKLTMALTVLAVIAFGLGVFIGVNSLRTNRFVSAQISNLRKTNDPNAPSEDQPSTNDLNNYKVPATDPRLLTISKLGVNARVKKLSVKSDNQLDAPTNIFDAGWYDGSARPDEAGAMLIDGHVQGPTKPGIFMKLDTLSAGDKLSIERGDGKTFTYHVVKSQKYDSNTLDMRITLNSVEPDKKGLNIITCTGSYDTKSKNYTQRLVVFAVQDN